MENSFCDLVLCTRIQVVCIDQYVRIDERSTAHEVHLDSLEQRYLNETLDQAAPLLAVPHVHKPLPRLPGPQSGEPGGR